MSAGATRFAGRTGARPGRFALPALADLAVFLFDFGKFLTHVIGWNTP